MDEYEILERLESLEERFSELVGLYQKLCELQGAGLRSNIEPLQNIFDLLALFREDQQRHNTAIRELAAVIERANLT